LFGTLRNSFRRRSSSANKRNLVTPKSEHSRQVFPIINSKQNDKVQLESNDNCVNINNLNNENCVPENALPINYHNSNASILKTTKIADNLESNLDKSELQANSEHEDQQRSVDG